MHSEIRPHVEGWVDVDQIDFAPEFLEQRGHDQLVVAPDEPVAEILLQGSGKLPKSGLAGGECFTPGHVHGLDLLPGAGCSGLRPTLRRRPY
jgi:hypothetical protein